MKTHPTLIVPQGMQKAAGAATYDIDPDGYIMLPGLQAAIEWLAENPVTPTAMVDQVAQMIWSFNLDARPQRNPDECNVWTEEHEACKRIYWDIARIACQITFSQAFKPEPDIPKDLTDLVLTGAADETVNMGRGGLNALLVEAYNRGKQAQPKIIEQAKQA